MKNVSVVVALVVGLVIGLAVGRMTVEPKAAAAPSVADNNNPSPSKAPTPTANAGQPIYKVPVGDGHVRGPADAPVTIVEFADYQCPFCIRAFSTLQKIRQNYGNEIRFVFKNNPLPFHQYAAGAAEAAEAAAAQGKFWPYHDKLYGSNGKLTEADLTSYAQQLGLDMAKFKHDTSTNAFASKINAQKQEAISMGAGGTPAFFINGVYVRGAQPYATFKRVIDAQLAKAKAMEAKGVAAKALYATIIRNGRTTIQRTPPPTQHRAPPRSQFAKVIITPKDHVRGPANAKVTVVEWSDYQCPFCKRAEPTVMQILKTYGKNVRFVFRNFPLSFHQYAHIAAEAAEAANAQGKFWAYHDKLYEVSPKLDKASLIQYAQQLHLNMPKFKKALATNEYKSFIDGQEANGSRHGVQGTPTFFIDGRKIVGAQPFSSFKTVIDQEMKKADALIKKGTPRKDLYAKLMAENEKTYGKSAPAAPSRPAPDANKVYKIAIGNAPALGPRHAPVTMVEWSDFQCPFCKRAEGTVMQVLKKYKGKIRFVYKQFPLPFHPYAQKAAEASLAAKAQGKFWPYHNLLFKKSPDLAVPKLEQYAKQVGLNMSRFKKALASNEYAAAVAKEEKQGQSYGTNGTPTFFINGHKLVGAQPLSRFEAVIDQQLKAHQ